MTQFEIDLPYDQASRFDATFHGFVRDQIGRHADGLKLCSFSPRPGVERRVVTMPAEHLLNFQSHWTALSA